MFRLNLNKNCGKENEGNIRQSKGLAAPILLRRPGDLHGETPGKKLWF